MKKFKIHLFLLLLTTSASQAQDGVGLGLPIWPLVTGSPDEKTITPHEVVDWREVPPSIGSVPGTKADKVSNDKSSNSQVGFDDCGNMVFYALHKGTRTMKNALELFKPDGTKLLGYDTSPSAPNASHTDGEIQIVKRPGYSSQWYLIYGEQNSDSYNCRHTLYSLIEFNGGKASYVLIGSEPQKDIKLVAPASSEIPISENDNGIHGTKEPRLYVDGKAVSRISKTISSDGHDLYLHRRYDTKKPKRVLDKEFSIDRFEISKDGISWSANSGVINSCCKFSLAASGSPIELSTNEDKLAVINRDATFNNTVYMFSLEENTNGDFLNNTPEKILLADLLVVPDENNASKTEYIIKQKDGIGTYKSVSYLGSENTYLSFLTNFQNKMTNPQFSPDGKKLYLSGGGWDEGDYGHLTYLCQIDLINKNDDGNHPVRLQIQHVQKPNGEVFEDDWNLTSGRQGTKWKWGDGYNSYNDFNSVSVIQASYDGHLYFKKSRVNKIFMIPNPNDDMTVNLIPGDIDLCLDNDFFNIDLQGNLHSFPDQIDGFNYLKKNYISFDIPFEYKTKQETDNVCELVCSPIDLSLQDQDGNIIAESKIDDCGFFTVCVPSSKNYRFKLVGNGMEFDNVIVGGALKTPPNSDFFNFTSDNCNPVPCEECKTSFSPQPGREYLLSAWVKEEYTDLYPDTYRNSGIQITFNNGAIDNLPIFKPTGPIIDGWQRIEQSFLVPGNAANIQINLKNLSVANNSYFDDVRVHTFSGNMKSYVYDPSTQKLTAELDENNYATKYEYDDEGILIRVKKETTRGVMTIKESRNNQSKINK